MSFSQTLLSIVALMFLSSILLGFYRILGGTGNDIDSGQDGILATTLSTSYMELAQGLAFDSVTDTSEIALQNPSVLTAPGSLGRESASEDSIHKFNDFDDFNNFVVEKEALGTGRRYRTSFRVQYVSPDNIASTSSTRTFVKRMDMKTWRVNPLPPPGYQLDTLRTSLVLGYFHFD